MILWYTVENVDQIPSPALVVYPERIQENLRRMIVQVGDPSRLRPHVKTHKMPHIIAMKLAAGITKFKASTIAEVEMTAVAGGNDILLAYQPVGPNAKRFTELIHRFPMARISAIVDNADSIDEISRAAADRGVIANLYLDLNVGMNRTGIAPGLHAAEIYRKLCRSKNIVAGGFHAYDGHLHEPDLELLRRQAEQAFAPVWRLREQLISEGLEVPNVIAAGTPTSRFLSQHPGVEVSAGTTVLWDAGQPEISPDLDFQHAAVLLARVISRPTASRICIDVGHKSVASEMPQPRVRWFGLEDAAIVMHSEEHMVLETDRGHEYPVGTVLYGIPRHVCPTVALYNEVWVVRDHLATETWPVVARARCLTI